MVGSQGLARGVLVMSAIHCLALIDRTMVAGAMPLVRRSIAMTDAEAGWLLGMPFAVSFAGAALVLGRVADRVPARRLMIMGLVTWSLASGALGLVHSVSAFAACRVALGIGQAAFIPAAIAWIVDATVWPRRPTAVAAFTTGSTVGRCVSLLAVGVLLLLLQRLGAGEGAWRWLFVVTVLPNLLALGLLVGLPVGAHAQAVRADAMDGAEWRALLPYFAVAIMPLMLGQAIGGWLPMLFVEQWQLTPGETAIRLGLLTLVAAPAGQVAGGWLMTHWAGGPRQVPLVIAGATVLAIVPLVLLCWSGVPALAGAGVLGVNVVLGIGTFSGLFGLQALVPAGRRGTVNGAYFAIVAMVGVGVGPLLAGMLSTLGGGGDGALANALVATGVIAGGLAIVAACVAQPAYRALAQMR